jgi:hypothetical protein
VTATVVDGASLAKEQPGPHDREWRHSGPPTDGHRDWPRSWSVPARHHLPGDVAQAQVATLLSNTIAAAENTAAAATN